MDLTTKNVLNFQEAVEYTGFKPSYLYKLTSADIVPFYKPTGKMLFFRREELEDFLTGRTEHRKESKNEIQKKMRPNKAIDLCRPRYCPKHDP